LCSSGLEEMRWILCALDGCGYTTQIIEKNYWERIFSITKVYIAIVSPTIVHKSLFIIVAIDS
jgi:hypothetical protein